MKRRQLFRLKRISFRIGSNTHTPMKIRKIIISVIILIPPYQKITPNVKEDKISAIGKKIEYYLI